ncbi:MAG TPA: hypothetical protein VFQ20_00695 [Burkholderiaceae bacterium]|nr:hypothetical protein [Burkholderiaceae bacterium]
MFSFGGVTAEYARATARIPAGYKGFPAEGRVRMRERARVAFVGADAHGVKPVQVAVPGG